MKIRIIKETKLNHKNYAEGVVLQVLNDVATKLIDDGLAEDTAGIYKKKKTIKKTDK